ncbi:type II secretion system F family protein [Clostridiales bacterium COT073_COT-073]|nr:type II secretion system F family protein [Clostridiales bacterium COT073_COT-073]
MLFALFLLIQGRRTYGDGYAGLDKKEFPLKDLMSMGAYWGYNILKEKHLDLAPGQVEKTRQLYGQMTGPREVENKVRLFYIHKLTILALLIGAASLIGLLTAIQSLTTGSPDQPRQITEIARPNFLEGDKEITYQVVAENKNPQNANDTQTDMQISIVVPRREPTQEELKEALKIARENIETLALGKNRAWDQVITSLDLYKYDKRSGLSLKWETEEASLFYSDGTMRSHERPKDGKKEKIKISIYYQDQKMDELEKEVTILPMQYTDAELRSKAIEEAGADINQQEQYVGQAKVSLPGEDAEKDVQMQWFEYIENTGQDSESKALQYFALFFGLAIVAYMGYDQELKRQIKERQTRIEMEFPIFVDKFVLLLNCGNSVGAALNQSIQSALAGNPEKANHPLYQELKIMYQEIQQGISDVDAFENFGRRIRIPNIMKFSSLIGQAIRKGDREITNSLTGLVREAWEKKKQLAKEKGAKASTKMMIPLVIMLIAIIIMVMAPAIFQMGF